MNIVKNTIYVAVVTALASINFIEEAKASSIRQFHYGKWECKIDGRPAKMIWNQDSRNGFFSDNGSRWVPLRFKTRLSMVEFNFQHADGNIWYLKSQGENSMVGYTTWNGNRYPLSCWR